MSDEYHSVVHSQTVEVPEGIVAALDIAAYHRDSKGENLIKPEEFTMDRIVEELTREEPDIEFDTVADYSIKEGFAVITYKFPHAGVEQHGLENVTLPRIKRTVEEYSDNQYTTGEWEIRVAEGETL